MRSCWCCVRQRTSTWRSAIFLGLGSLQEWSTGDAGDCLHVSKPCWITKQLSYSWSLKRIYDQIWENPPYGINAQSAQCAFLVPQAKNCQSPDFVISMSNNPSSNCCCRLWRLVVSYKGKISLHFDLPSLYSCLARSPLLRALIRIPAHGLSRYS